MNLPRRSRKICNHFKDEGYRPKCGKPWLKQDVIPTSNLNTIFIEILYLYYKTRNICPNGNIKSHRFFEVDRYIGDSSTPTRPRNLQITDYSLSHYFRLRLDEKLMALSLLKCSGRGYKLLSKIFCLPSRRALMQTLNKVPFCCWSSNL
ncbi:uncharacterized protein LOC143205354 [Rhynchophorus ferrugineus]|uniref:uncharacterized protein LOC143205354 n=1 Tax=Rhynchophorus ferrugineus TaxID=354439 RepID=UPI003FCDF7A7